LVHFGRGDISYMMTSTPVADGRSDESWLPLWMRRYVTFPDSFVVIGLPVALASAVSLSGIFGNWWTTSWFLSVTWDIPNSSSIMTSRLKEKIPVAAKPFSAFATVAVSEYAVPNYPDAWNSVTLYPGWFTNHFSTSDA
jgi:hypothetical protein